jgi:hypothetical protein
MGPDGSTYEVEAPDEKAAVAGFKRFQSGKFDAAPATPAEPAKPEPSTSEALARGVAQGATAEFGDELAGLAAASPVQAPWWLPGAKMGQVGLGGARLLAEKVAPGLVGTGGGEAYDRTVADQRAANAAAQEAHPIASFAGNLGGALLSAPATPMLAPLKGAGIARAAGNLAVTGAAYGGLAGAGAGEGDLVERLPSAVGGAVAGGLLTPPLGGLAAGAGKVGGFVADHIAASRNPQKVSDRIVARALEADQADAGALAQQITADQARPAAEVQNLTAADLAGPNTRAAAGNAVRHHGPARTEGQKLLRERQEGSETAFSQADRIDNQLSDIAGPGGSLATEDRILAQRSADGRRLYEGPMACAASITTATPARRCSPFTTAFPTRPRRRR